MANEKVILNPRVAVARATAPDAVEKAGRKAPPAPGARVDAPDAVERLLEGVGNQGSPSVLPPVVQQAAQPVKVWKFVKNFGPADLVKFPDGTNFSFRLIKLNDGSGYAQNSYVTTSDIALANNLRAASKNPALGIVETTV